MDCFISREVNDSLETHFTPNTEPLVALRWSTEQKWSGRDTSCDSVRQPATLSAEQSLKNETIVILDQT